jgi:hypothetical protein
MEIEEELDCPLCGEAIAVDSIRRHRDGGKRVYWECGDCNLSVMLRDVAMLD